MDLEGIKDTIEKNLGTQVGLRHKYILKGHQMPKVEGEKSI